MNIKLINSRRQPNKLKKVLTNVEFRQSRSSSAKMPKTCDVNVAIHCYCRKNIYLEM